MKFLLLLNHDHLFLSCWSFGRQLDVLKAEVRNFWLDDEELDCGARCEGRRTAPVRTRLGVARGVEEWVAGALRMLWVGNRLRVLG